MTESIFLIAVSLGLIALLFYTVRNHKQRLEKERIENERSREAQRKIGHQSGIEWRGKVLSLIEKHKYSLAQERKRYISKDAYGNILDNGWSVKASSSTTGVFYFIRNVLKTNISGYEKGEERFGRYILKTGGIADTIHWVERSINEACDEIESRGADEDISTMSGEDYENHCLQILEDAGWEVEGTPVTGDQGVDLIAMIEDVRVCIQCKRYSKPVGNKAVQEIAAGMTHWNGTHAVVVSNAGFTKSAHKLAESTGVLLISDMELENLEGILNRN